MRWEREMRAGKRGRLATRTMLMVTTATVVAGGFWVFFAGGDADVATAADVVWSHFGR